ncbi:hypothetical protein MJM43_30685, partial [Salmonella enterica subsp. enterica serovar Montevideo]|nr:hypothetical protein [Salmonella enterica subsp. enterica serovar Montevideo]
EEEAKRKTQHPLLPGAIAEFNQYEFSRAMRHKDCINPLRVYSFEHWLATCRARGTSVVAISHDAAFTRRHFSRVVRLHNGAITP